jgi:hypothetical protein
MIKELDYPSYSSGGFQRISWGAVFAGAIVSLGVLVLLTSLGAGIGLASAPAAANAANGANAALGFGVGAGIWMLLTGIISFYAGGWIAGRLTGIARVSESVIHGIVCWATATVMLAFVFTTATVGAIGAASNAVGSTLGRQNTVDNRTITPGDAQNASRAAGAAGMFGFVMLLCDGLAAGYGARAGTRVLKPVPMSEVRRERVGV